MNFTTVDEIRNPPIPKMYVILYVICIWAAGLSDWPKLSFGMYLKVFSLGGLALALLRMFWKSDYRRVKVLGKFLLVFVAPLVFVYLLSLGLWSTKTMDASYITRGTEKIIYQFITVGVVIGGSYLFGSKAIDYTFYGLVAANTTIFLVMMVDYGIPEALMSIMESVQEMSNSHGFLYKIEIHDITFCMGLFVIYYLFEKRMVRKQWLHVAIAAFYFIIGFKRIAILAVIMAILVMLFLKKIKQKRVGPLIIIACVLIILVCFGYIYFITEGYWTEFMQERNIDMAGRNRIYKYMAQFYTIDPTFTGYGFEYTVALLRGMRASGTEVIHVTAIHCDILKQYIELGFWGYIIWMVYNYVFQAAWYKKCYGSKTMILFFAVSLYAWVTYMTDNTIYYFWLSMCLRFVMISYAFRQIEAKERKTMERREDPLFHFKLKENGAE